MGGSFGGRADAAECATCLKTLFLPRFSRNFSRVFSIMRQEYPPFNDLSTTWIHSECVSIAHYIAGTSVADLSTAGAELSASCADLSWISFDNAAAHRLVQLSVLIAGV